ncbi:MAG: 3-hydroxyacyl-CoA dehydrogenase family protein [Thermoleophilia bacterium]|nr:3-hydroxyacyl-CoA dehydrogenase family protein [Thermoleophilia bacterium]
MSPHGVQRALVVGAGVMGSSIAQVLATAGRRVALVDTDSAALTRAEALIRSGVSTLVEYGKLPSEAVADVVTRIEFATYLPAAAGDADFVVEAVPEIPAVKRQVFAELDALCRPDAVIASNTSGLDVFELAEMDHPERLIIAHFFLPAHIIPLVEVVAGEMTSPETIATTVGVLEAAGKTPVVLRRFVRSFIVNRIQNAIGLAVGELLENGWAEPADIDRAVKLSLGIRLPVVGVAQTADFNGLDLVRDIFASLGRPSAYFERKVQQGHLGVKTGRGLYDYGDRSEAEVLEKRDLLYLRMLDALTEIGAFEPV